MANKWNQADVDTFESNVDLRLSPIHKKIKDYFADVEKAILKDKEVPLPSDLEDQPGN